MRTAPIALALLLLAAGPALAQSYRSGVTRGQCSGMGGTQFTVMSSPGIQPELGNCYIPPRITTPSAPGPAAGGPAMGAAGAFMGAAMGIMQMDLDRQRRQAAEQEAAAAAAAAENARREEARRAAEAQAAEERRQREAADAARRTATPNPFGGQPARGATPFDAPARPTAGAAAPPARRAALPPVRPQTFCAEVASLARQNENFARGGDPAHAAAARNYANAHAAFCNRGGGASPPPRATEVGAGILGPLGLLAGLADPLTRAVLGEQERRAEEARLDRLLADADAELERARRACPPVAAVQPASTNPFDAPRPAPAARPGCARADAPLAVEDHPRYDSVRRRICTVVVLNGPDACVPNQTRRELRRLASDIREASAAGRVDLFEMARREGRGSSDYSPHVLREEDFRRLAAGERFEDVYHGGMTDRVLEDVTRRMNEATGASRGR